MLLCAELKPLDQDEAAYRKKSLRDAVICVGWMKFISIGCYVSIYLFTHAYTTDNMTQSMSKALQIMTLFIIGPQIFHGLVLFYGAIEDRVLGLDISLWMCVLIAAYNCVLGVMGCIFFIRSGEYTAHFLLACAYGLLALSILTVICHDILVVYAYKQLLVSATTPGSIVTWEKD